MGFVIGDKACLETYGSGMSILKPTGGRTSGHELAQYLKKKKSAKLPAKIIRIVGTIIRSISCYGTTSDQLTPERTDRRTVYEIVSKRNLISNIFDIVLVKHKCIVQIALVWHK